MKKVLVSLTIRILSLPLYIFPPAKAANFCAMLFKLMTLKAKPKDSLIFLFNLSNKLYETEGGIAKRYGNGAHPKHRLTKYHDFFIDNIKDGETVIDLGCGKGEVAYDIAIHHPKTYINGIDISKDSINFANNTYPLPNISFNIGDIYKYPYNSVDVVILSNVLEHLKKRSYLLKHIHSACKPKRILIRVPLFERDWSVALQKELGIDYRLDPIHEIEYTSESFDKEIKSAGLKIKSKIIRWGEIWAVVKI